MSFKKEPGDGRLDLKANRAQVKVSPSTLQENASRGAPGLEANPTTGTTGGVGDRTTYGV